MKKPLYIHGLSYISAQATFEKSYFFEEITDYQTNPVHAKTPNYKELIPALQLRRMNKSMRMALYTGLLAKAESGFDQIDAIITATGQGCLMDSEKFVETLIEDESQMLNPTPFIQSTHNMAAATLALALDCKGYNMTYVNGPQSFESALMDASLYARENPNHSLLVGGVDELGIRSQQFWALAGFLNTKNPRIPTVPSSFDGEIASEGASFFAMSSQKNTHTKAMLSGMDFKLKENDPVTFVRDFLARHHTSAEDIDVVLLGCNGDQRYDDIYWQVAETFFPGVPLAGFKHVLGEYDTVIGTAMAIATQILTKQYLPSHLLLDKSYQANTATFKNILIYNQRAGQHHSLLLITQPL